MTARNLRDDVLKWSDAWKQKEVSVMAWAGGGMSSGNGTYKFFDHLNPGRIILEAEMSDEAAKNINQHASRSQYILIKGRVKSGQRSLLLTNCSVAGYLDSPIISTKLTPYTLKADWPVLPQDICNAIQAWQGVQVVIVDKCKIPMTGNTISIVDINGKSNQYGFKPDIIRAVLKTSIKNQSLPAPLKKSEVRSTG